MALHAVDEGVQVSPKCRRVVDPHFFFFSFLSGKYIKSKVRYSM